MAQCTHVKSNALMVHTHEPPKATILCHSLTSCPSVAPWNRQTKDAGYLDYTGLSLD